MWRLLVLLALLTALPGGLAAGEFYVGVGIGEKAAGGQFSQPLREFGVEASDQGHKAFVGAEISELLALEGTYYDFGTRTCCPGLADAGFVTDLNAFSAALVGRFPMEQVEFFAKAGALFWQEKGEEITIAGPRQLSAEGSDMVFGAGVWWRIAGKFSLGAEWEALEVGGDSISGLWLNARIGF